MKTRNLKTTCLWGCFFMPLCVVALDVKTESEPHCQDKEITFTATGLSGDKPAYWTIQPGYGCITSFDGTPIECAASTHGNTIKIKWNQDKEEGIIFLTDQDSEVTIKKTYKLFPRSP